MRENVICVLLISVILMICGCFHPHPDDDIKVDLSYECDPNDFSYKVKVDSADPGLHLDDVSLFLQSQGSTNLSADYLINGDMNLSQLLTPYVVHFERYIRDINGFLLGNFNLTCIIQFEDADDNSYLSKGDVLHLAMKSPDTGNPYEFSGYNIGYSLSDYGFFTYYWVPEMNY